MRQLDASGSAVWPESARPSASFARHGPPDGIQLCGVGWLSLLQVIPASSLLASPPTLPPSTLHPPPAALQARLGSDPSHDPDPLHRDGGRQAHRAGARRHCQPQRLLARRGAWGYTDSVHACRASSDHAPHAARHACRWEVAALALRPSATLPVFLPAAALVLLPPLPAMPWFVAAAHAADPACPALCPARAPQAEQLTRLLHDFYTVDQKYSFVHAFNHRQSEFDLKRMLDSLGHDTAQLPQD